MECLGQPTQRTRHCIQEKRRHTTRCCRNRTPPPEVRPRLPDCMLNGNCRGGASTQCGRASTTPSVAPSIPPLACHVDRHGGAPFGRTRRKPAEACRFDSTLSGTPLPTPTVDPTTPHPHTFANRNFTSATLWEFSDFRRRAPIMLPTCNVRRRLHSTHRAVIDQNLGC